MNELVVRFLGLMVFPRRVAPCDNCKQTKLVWLIAGYRSLYCSACLATHDLMPGGVMSDGNELCRLCGFKLPPYLPIDVSTGYPRVYLPVECMEQDWTSTMAHVHRKCLQTVMQEPDLDAMTVLVEA